jgi:NAD(P)-dependent dehydrogenase (short-subunit alcohol dehydrogenase family)
MALFDLTGKVAVVTGASRGIGQGIAVELARAGANLVLTDVIKCDETIAQIQALKKSAVYFKADVSNERHVKKLMALAMKTFQKIDILVNNAGIYKASPTMNVSDRDWENIIHIDLKGTFLCAREALRYMKAGASIINISSIAGIVGFAQGAAYCAAKGGVRLFTKSLAAEVAKQGIRVNSVHPGVIETPMTVDILKDPNMKNSMIQGVPMGRTGKPLDIAGPVVFLASDASSYMTGSEIVVDGGWTATS